MKQEKRKHENYGKILKFCIAGIVLNYGITMVAAVLNLPLYMDCIGTVLVTVLGGGLPGVIVAFISTLLRSINNSLNLYYGIPALLFVWCICGFRKHGWLKKWSGRFLLMALMAGVGALTSTVVGWYMFGEQINGIAAPLAFRINDRGAAPFLSQLLAELILELIDKMICVSAAFFILHFLKGKEEAKESKTYGHSVNGRIVNVVVLCVALVGICVVIIGGLYYQNLLHINSMNDVKYIAAQAAMGVNGDSVEQQFEEGKTAPDYAKIQASLDKIYMEQMSLVDLYVCVEKEDGCYILYDVDTTGMGAREVGTYVEKDADIYNHLTELRAGNYQDPEYGKNALYGPMLAAYEPIYDSSENVVAYVCAEVAISPYVQQLMIYIIHFSTVVCGIILVTILFMIMYVNKIITKPIQTIVEQTRQLDSISPENWLTSKEWAERVPITTDDELEELYQTVTAAEKNASVNVKKRIETEQELLQTREFEAINKELEQMIQKADDANRAKTDFLSRMSHDMRTPMNAIIGLSALTLDDAENPEIVRENMSKIRSSSDFLLGLVNDILDLAKIEDGAVILQPEPYTYKEFLTNMRTMFQAQCDAKDIQLSIKDLKTNPMVRIDKMRMNQIFFNILSNAVKYTPVGGKIDYSVENFKTNGKELSVDFVISDTGIGMSEEYQKHLFEAFVQESGEVTPELQGSGLGLSITKHLVDLMGGTIDISSKKGMGTTVRIHLDMECIEIDAKEIQKSQVFTDNELELQGKQILLAEDHPLNAQIARKLLEKKGMKVTHAQNGKLAVEIFRTSEEFRFDAILMDIRMPELSGLDAAKQIRALERKDAKTVVIVAMSANAYPEDIQKSREAGMNSHLPKPVEPEKLYQTLRKYMIAAGHGNKVDGI